MSVISRQDRRERKHLRVRKRVHGTAERPRLNVFRSSKHIYAQIIDDVKGHTLVAASSASGELKDLKSGANKAAARAVGKLIAAATCTTGGSRKSPSVRGKADFDFRF